MPAATRDRIVEATSGLFRRQGYLATGVKQIVATADAPFGSLYHFFPGGKEQLGAEVIRASGTMYYRLFEAFMDAAPDVVSGIESFFEGAAVAVEATDYADACPIATIALEVASTNEPLRVATADVFELWISCAAGRFAAAGIAPEVARDLAISTIALLEGAFIFARSMRTPDPVRITGASAAAAIRAALPAVASDKAPA